MKKLLIIGGTRFVGRNLVEKLINCNCYDITIFNRGFTNPQLFPEISKIIGDRKKADDLHKIAETFWDCIIDLSGYWPDALEQQLSIQNGNFDKYIYLSTSSHYVFDEENPHLIEENEPIVPCSIEEKHSEEQRFYNQKKAACERILQKQVKNLIILRPGLIIGRYDTTNRLYYWLHKVYTQDKILMTESSKNVLSFSFIKDVIKAIFYFIENEAIHCIYNTGSFIASVEDFVQLAIEKLGKKPLLVYASPSFLEKNQVAEWVDLPLCINGNYFQIDNSRLWNEMQINPTDIQTAFESIYSYYAKEQNWKTPAVTPPAMDVETEKRLLSIL